MIDSRCGLRAESGKQVWENVLLTSSGWYSSFEKFDESTVKKNILNHFKDMLRKPAEQAKVLFIPTAANSDESRPAAGSCLADLLSAGILPNNIRIYDIDGSLTADQAMEYDVIYFTGGDTQYLLDRINATGFNVSLKNFVDNGGVYVGVSAGSMIATNNLPNNLGLINCTLSVHEESGSKVGIIDVSENPHIALKDSNPILIHGDKYKII